MPKVTLTKSADTLTQRDWLAYVRARRAVQIPQDPTFGELAYATVQAALVAGWLECEGVDPADVGAWPLSVDLIDLTRAIGETIKGAQEPDPKA